YGSTPLLQYLAHGSYKSSEVGALEDRGAGRPVEAEHAVPRVPARARLGHEPDDARDPVADGTQAGGAGRQPVVAGVAEHEEERRPGEERPLREELLQHATEVRAGMEVERPARRARARARAPPRRRAR